MKGQEREREEMKGGNAGREGRRKVGGRRTKEIIPPYTQEVGSLLDNNVYKDSHIIYNPILHASKKFKDAPHVYAPQITRINHSSQ